MMQVQALGSRRLRQAIACFATASVLLLAGCGGMETTASEPTNFEAGTVGGTVYGGQYPISGAAVKVWAAGTSGYGSGSTTPLATTTTGSNGNFSFTVTCPTASSQIYITAVGGNPQAAGTGTSSGQSNPASALMAAIGRCDGITTNTNAQINELTTVASVFALAPYMNPGSGIGGATIGAPNTTQAQLGIANAASSIANLVNTSTGTAVTSNSLTGTGTAVGVTMTATPESAKLITIADILASCINSANPTGTAPAAATITNFSITNNVVTFTAANSFVVGNSVTIAGLTTGTYLDGNTLTILSASATQFTASFNNGGTTVTSTADSGTATPVGSGGTSGTCSDLFTHAVIPQLASATSLGSGTTFSTASDTIQAAYYMAVNPINYSSSFAACNNGGTTNMSCLFNLATPQAPFQSGLSAQPTDWTLGVTYTASGTCTGGNGQPFIQGAYHSAVDASGNIWFVNGAATAGENLSEINSVGVPIGCYSTATTAAGRGLSIDPTGNIWASFNVPIATGVGIQELPASGSALVAWPTTVNPYTIVSDTAGNIFFSSIDNGGTMYEFTSPGTSTTPTTNIFLAGPVGVNENTASTISYLAVDSTNRIWIDTSTTASLFYLYPDPNTGTSYSVSGYSMATGTGTTTFSDVVTFTTSAQSPALVAGQDLTLAGFTSAAATTYGFNGLHVTVASPTSTSFQATISTATKVASVTTGTETAATATLQTDTLGSIPETTASTYGLGIDSSNNIFDGTTCCGSAAPYRTFEKNIPPTTNGGTGTVSNSVTNFAGINGVRSLVLDGAANIWVGNEFPSSTGATATTGTYGIGEASAGFAVALSPTGTAPGTCSTSAGCGTGGTFEKTGINEPYDIEIDPSGNVWVMDSGTQASTTSGSAITEIVGAAVPVVTPLSVAAKNSKLATKP